MNYLLTSIKKTRAIIMTNIKPKRSYFLATKSTQPISHKFGFDRGNPIDRFYIESFLEENKDLIKGKTLEVVDNKYTKQFGGKNVSKSEIIDNNKKNKNATIHADLRNMEGVPSESFDCLILTQTFGMIDDLDLAIKECYRILKKDGVLLATMSSLNPVHDIENNYWRFTWASAKLVFGKQFKNLTVKTYGNVLSGQGIWVGLAQEELTREELEYNDPNYPCIVAIKGVK